MTIQIDPSEILKQLRMAVYTCDVEGRLMQYNDSTISLWGREPSSTDRWYGWEKAYGSNDAPLTRDSCPMSVAVREKRSVDNEEIVIERPDGTRRNVLASSRPLLDGTGEVLGSINVLVDVTKTKGGEEASCGYEASLRDFIENASVGLHCVGADGRIKWANRAELDLLGYSLEEYVGRPIADFHDDPEVIEDILSRLSRGQVLREYEARMRCKDGSIRHVMINSSALFADGKFIHTRCFTRDITDRKRVEALRESLLAREWQSREEAETLNEIARSLLAQRDVERLLQEVTDAGTRLTGADFGAFFYNAVDEKGQSYRLYALSGVPREAFAKFDLPRKTPIFEPTFRGRGVVRLDDVTADSRYGHNAPHRGMPGHLPVRSYLAVPVKARSGEVLGGLFFGHPEKGVFGERAERVALGIASQAAVALDNARLFAEQEEGKRQLHQIIDALPVAVYTTDAMGKLTHFNKAAVEFAGHQPVLGEDQWCVSWKLYHSDGRPMPHQECPMAVALKGGQVPQGVEAIAERPDGRRVWFTPYPIPLRNAQGQTVGGVNMLLDITERKESQRRLAHLAAIVASSDDAIISKDLNGIITSWNGAAERLFGYSEAEAIGQPITMLIPPERISEEWDILARIRRGERIHHYETIRRRKDGTRIDISLSISAITDSQGRIVGASKIARDITEHKQAVEGLRASEERYRLLYESIDEGYCIIQVVFDANDRPSDYVFLEVNPAFEKQTGIVNARGKSMREIALNHEEHWFELYGNVAVTGEPKRFEYPAAELNRWYEGYAFRIGQAHERRVGIVFNDITERKQTEERLRQLTKELESKVAERTEELMQTRQRVGILTSQLLRHRSLGGSA